MQETKDWQNEAETIKDRISSLYSNQLFTDVEILVGTEDTKLFKASKVILASGSAVFASMLFGSAVVKMSPILLPDIEPVVFESMLECIYLDKISTNDENVIFSIYSAAEKYQMPSLKESCVDMLMLMPPNPENACFLFEKAILGKIEKLENFYIEQFRENTRAILNSKQFLEAREISVRTILSQPSVYVSSEMEMFKGLIKWINHSSNRKAMRNDLLRYICFRNLKRNNWDALIRLNPGIFNDAEIKKVFKCFDYGPGNETPEWCIMSNTREYIKFVQSKYGKTRTK